MTYPPPRTKPVRRGPPQAGRAGAEIFAALAKKTKFADPALSEHWPTIAGAKIAALCRPGRITGMRGARTLEVHAPSGAAAAQLQLLTDDLKIRVNKYLGPNGLARITIRQFAVATPPAPADSAGGPSPLDEALASFRRSIGKTPQ